MVIIYGTRSSHLNSHLLEDAVCPSCQTQGEVVFSVFSSYAHVLWIPFFPLVKSNVITCNHCNDEIDINELPEEYHDQCKSFQKAQRKPIWHFAGLIAIALLVVFAVIETSYLGQKEESYLVKPRVDDIYYYKSEKGYSTMKIVSISDDIVTIADNKFYMDVATNLSEIDIDDNYDMDELIEITRELLVKMKQDKQIIRIIRK